MKNDAFTLPDAHLREYCRRDMHFGVREFAASISAGAVIFCCSCEKHRLGEDPEAQKEHTEGNPAAPNKAEVSDSAMKSPTPAEFFPKTTPAP